MKRIYEGTGGTLEEALKEFPGKKRLTSLETLRVEIRITRGETVVASYQGSNYQRAFSIVTGLAKRNTGGEYHENNPAYQKEVHVRGNY